MGSIILLYVNDTDVDDPRTPRKPGESDQSYFCRQTPMSGILDALKYPSMCLVVRPDRLGSDNHLNLRNFVRDRRGLWMKWQSCLRDPQDYMYVYKYCDEKSKLYPNLFVNAVLIGTFDDIDQVGNLVREIVAKYSYYSACMISASVTHLYDKYPDNGHRGNLLGSEIPKPDVNIAYDDWVAVVSLVREITLSTCKLNAYLKKLNIS